MWAVVELVLFGAGLLVIHAANPEEYLLSNVSWLFVVAASPIICIPYARWLVVRERRHPLYRSNYSGLLEIINWTIRYFIALFVHPIVAVLVATSVWVLTAIF
jgi:hypothetical protein